MIRALPFLGPLGMVQTESGLRPQLFAVRMTQTTPLPNRFEIFQNTTFEPLSVDAFPGFNSPFQRRPVSRLTLFPLDSSSFVQRFGGLLPANPTNPTPLPSPITGLPPALQRLTPPAEGLSVSGFESQTPLPVIRLLAAQRANFNFALPEKTQRLIQELTSQSLRMPIPLEFARQMDGRFTPVWNPLPPLRTGTENSNSPRHLFEVLMDIDSRSGNPSPLMMAFDQGDSQPDNRRRRQQFWA